MRSAFALLFHAVLALPLLADDYTERIAQRNEARENEVKQFGHSYDPLLSVEGRARYTAALDRALRSSDDALACLLLERGANPDLILEDDDEMFPRSPAIFRAAFRGGDERWGRLLRVFLKYEADVSATRKDGATALMIAERANARYAIALLQKAGAKPVDFTTDLGKALAVKIDVEIIQATLLAFFSENSGEMPGPVNRPKFLAFEAARVMSATQPQVFQSGLVDIYGNPFVFGSRWEVFIHPETLEKTSTIVGKEFWEGFAK